MLGLASLCAAALTLSACGGGANATTERAATAPPGRAAGAKPAGDPCRHQLGGFLKAMTALRGNLAVGLSYEQYAAEMHGVRAAYAGIPIARLTLGCLARTGAPAERALNRYTDAANVWGECLAKAGCTTASIEHTLQHRWRVASDYLSEAQ
jgi:hypothetical protein